MANSYVVFKSEKIPEPLEKLEAALCKAGPVFERSVVTTLTAHYDFNHFHNVMLDMCVRYSLETAQTRSTEYHMFGKYEIGKDFEFPKLDAVLNCLAMNNLEWSNWEKISTTSASQKIDVLTKHALHILEEINLSEK
jgi:hypothetical protein